MKKLILASFILVFIFAFAPLILAEGKGVILAEGAMNEAVSYKIVNYGSEEKPACTLFIEGSGAFTGLDSEGNELKYQTRESSIFAPYYNSINKVEIGEGIEEIGSYGIAFLKNATSLVIPKGLVIIGGAALQDMKSLKKITVRGEKAPTGYDFDLSYVTSIKNYAFSGCNSVRTIKLSDSLEGILGKQTFINCHLLERLTVPEGISVVGEECFKNCASLYYVHFLGAPSIDSRAFSGSEHTYIVCSDEGIYGELKEKELNFAGASLSDVPFYPEEDVIDFGSCGVGLYWQIKKNEFWSADSPKYDLFIKGDGKLLMFRTKNNGSTNYNTYKNTAVAPYFKEITRAYIESTTVEEISGCFFTGMENLEQIMLPYSLTSLSGAIFEHCRALKSLYYSGNEPQDGVFDVSTVKKISAYCFDGCQGMKSIIFSDDLENESIGAETFKGCTGLTEFTVPACITSIEKNAFLGCENLTEVIFELDAAIDRRAFTDCDSLERFRGFADSRAEEFAINNKLDFLYPCQVAIRLVGSKRLLTNIGVIAGQGLDDFSVMGSVCLFYKDPEGNEPYDMKAPITETTTLYALPILRNISLFPIEGEKAGLAALYSLASTPENDIFRVVSAGAVASKDRGTSYALITKDTSFTYDIPFFGEGAKKESFAALPGADMLYSATAVGFEDEAGELISERVGEKLFFRGYAVIENKKTGERAVSYTDMISGSLYECGSAIGSDRISALTECERAPFTRDEMLGTTERIALGEMSPLFRGEIEMKDENFFRDHLESYYSSEGDVPAIIKFDPDDFFELGVSEEKIRRLALEIKEYSEAGGSVMLNLRPYNPANFNGSTTDGRLGARDWSDLFDRTTPTSMAYFRNLGKCGMLLQFLKEEGVSVYLCLMPEVASDSRWWSAPAEKGGDMAAVAQYYRAVWEMTVPYYTEDCSLDNIIWVFEGGEDADEYLPGMNFVDICGSEFESATGKTYLSDIK